MCKGPSGNTSSSFYLWSKRIGGEGVETSENVILEGKLNEKGGESGSRNQKLEENDKNFFKNKQEIYVSKLTKFFAISLTKRLQLYS